jgi:hypothetical protein
MATQVLAQLDGAAAAPEAASDRVTTAARLTAALADALAQEGTTVLVLHGKLMALWLGEQLATRPSRVCLAMDRAGISRHVDSTLYGPPLMKKDGL